MKITFEIDPAEATALAITALDVSEAPAAALGVTQRILTGIVCTAAGQMLRENTMLTPPVAALVTRERSPGYRPRRPALLPRRHQANFGQ